MRLKAEASKALKGDVAVPGDKSLSHRALLLGAMAAGTTVAEGLLTGADVLATRAALQVLGVEIGLDGDTATVHGVGTGGLKEPDDVLDLGNAGTGARLLMGLLAGHKMVSVVTGDASLRRRPMARIFTPLEAMGTRFVGRAGGLLPVAVQGSDRLMPLDYQSPVASAQIKSAVLLAGLHAPGITRVVEPAASRDHTENMLREMGAQVTSERLEDGRHVAAVTGEAELKPLRYRIPGDPSSAAFPLVAALICPDSELALRHVGTNPLRTGLFQTLQEMGADLQVEETGLEAGEPVANLIVRQGPLQAIDVPAERAPSMIDEYPILAVAAAQATGRSVLRGLGELRVKESDRFKAIVDGLRANGVTVETDGDDLAITGTGGGRFRGGATINANHDHRIGMSFLVMGLASEAPITVDGAETIATSFPNFVGLMQELGAKLG